MYQICSEKDILVGVDGQMNESIDTPRLPIQVFFDTAESCT